MKMRKGNIKMFHKISIKSKFLMMILGIAIACITVVGFQGLQYGKESLSESMYDHLTSLRSARTQQIENYFQETENLMKTFAVEYTIMNAMQEFTSGFSLLDAYHIDTDANTTEELNAYYKQNLLPKLNAHSLEEYTYSTLVPKEEVSQYLQSKYIVNNPSEVGKKELFESAEDGSYYSEVHQKYHPVLRQITKNQGFYDLFLIDAKTQHIVYSVFKEVDFGTSLQNGIYAQSPLGKLVRDIINKPEKGVTKVSDFQNYLPSYNTPQAFFAIPIYDQNTFIGVLATQISSEHLNTITTGDKHWEKDGLGESGEVYIIGRDYKMRSESRKMIQDPDAYLSDINRSKLSKTSKQRINTLKSSILTQSVKSEAAKQANEGESGTIVTRNYLGQKVLSSFAPLNIDGLNWAIIVEKGIKEAEAPIRDFQNALLVSATILATLITFYSIWLAYSFLSPISRMAKGVKEVINSNSREKIQLNRNDEFGDLSDNIDTLIETINTQEQKIEEKSQENDRLLYNILPETIAERVKNGEKNIAESVNNVAVLFSLLKGFDQLSRTMEAQESIERLNELINQFDEQTHKFGIEKITTIGDSYMVASGLIHPRLDYARRMTEFAIKMFEIVDNFNTLHRSNLELSIGIDSGEVMAGIVGEYKFVYDIWGEAVNDANRIAHEALPGTLRVSKAVYTQLTNQEAFQPCEGGSEETYGMHPNAKGA
ncbi:MAG TPA: adenylate/guanylate cyclase domain-containing protein [Campylobacterales bacterium]|nr:adenylate/guanylate cyclase domain-containing protein [Campylobacterales bacterium]